MMNMGINPATVQTQRQNMAMMPCRQCVTTRVSSQAVQSEVGTKPSNKGVLTTALLLIGGAVLGYGHRNQISQGLDKLKTMVSGFFSGGKPAELLAKGKELLSKAKDVIFVKNA